MALNKIGIIGGTFNPIHYGHLIAAEWAKAEYNLDTVIFVPAANPPHKNSGEIIDKNHRYNMVQKAIQANKDFIISDFEIQKGGKSYTIDTLKYFKNLYPDSHLFFIIGFDSLLNLHTWYNIRGLLDLTTFLVAIRPGYEMEGHQALNNKLPENAEDKISLFQMPQIEISSSMIRERIGQGKSIKYLLPELVENYIYTNNIYGEINDRTRQG